jgi:hypothetical protein
MDASETIIDDACAYLRGHTSGELRFDEHTRPVKYVIAPDGRPVAPVMVATLQSVETVLFVPEERDGAMEVLVTPEEFEENGPHGGLADRWRIYHGEPEDVRWAFLDIDAARFERCIIDGEALVRPNPLATVEAPLCRWMNREHADDLRRICLHVDGREVERPLLVGIDPAGFDVRRKFDVIRVPAAAPMPDEAEARRVLEGMMDRARAAAESGDG